MPAKSELTVIVIPVVLVILLVAEVENGVEVVGSSTAAKFVACLLYCRCSEHGHRPGFTTLACKTDDSN